MSEPPVDPDRRPLKSRQKRVFHVLADRLARVGVSPNAISVVGMLAGIAAGGALVATSHASGLSQRLLWLAAAACVQTRLLCNLLDGMVAIGSGRQSKVGELYNELPDRVSDSFTLIGLGLAVGGNATLGYVAALLAIATAYVRAVGKAGGAGSDFSGPMAKPQRMFFTTLCAIACGASAWVQNHDAATWTLWLIVVGCALTLIRRTWQIARRLDQIA
jgi:phosphatidylglycerophosphate synthase